MQVLPALGNATAAGLHTLVPALVANLGSSNGKIAARAGDVLDQLMLSVNPTLHAPGLAVYAVRHTVK